MNKTLPIIESLVLVFIAWTISYHYDPYISTPSFHLYLNGKPNLSFRIGTDILIWLSIGLRISRLWKRKFRPIETQLSKIDWIIFIGYTILLAPDLWMFSLWLFFADTYLFPLLLFLSPWLFWLLEIYKSYSGLSKSSRARKMRIILIAIFLIIGLIRTRLYLYQLEFEDNQNKPSTEILWEQIDKI